MPRRYILNTSTSLTPGTHCRKKKTINKTYHEAMSLAFWYDGPKHKTHQQLRMLSYTTIAARVNRRVRGSASTFLSPVHLVGCASVCCGTMTDENSVKAYEASPALQKSNYLLFVNETKGLPQPFYYLKQYPTLTPSN